MADRRMFSKKITDCDEFTSLSANCQALYLHICLAADDDGFCNQVSTAIVKAHAKKGDLTTLINKKYLLQFNTGVVCVKHWKMHNLIRQDRKTPTFYQREFELLEVDNEGKYHLKSVEISRVQPNDNQMTTNCQPNDRIGKDSIGKVSIVEDSIYINNTHKGSVAPSVEEVEEHIKQKGYHFTANEFWNYYNAQGWKLSNGLAIKDWKSCCVTWENKRKPKIEKKVW